MTPSFFFKPSPIGALVCAKHRELLDTAPSIRAASPSGSMLRPCVKKMACCGCAAAAVLLPPAAPPGHAVD
eukprot:3212376-Amphidinium_carterae.1